MPLNKLKQYDSLSNRLERLMYPFDTDMRRVKHQFQQIIRHERQNGCKIFSVYKPYPKYE